MEKSYREILEKQELPTGYLAEIEAVAKEEDDLFMAATMAFLLGRIIGIRQERARRKAVRA